MSLDKVILKTIQFGYLKYKDNKLKKNDPEQYELNYLYERLINFKGISTNMTISKFMINHLEKNEFVDLTEYVKLKSFANEIQVNEVNIRRFINNVMGIRKIGDSTIENKGGGYWYRNGTLQYICVMKAGDVYILKDFAIPFAKFVKKYNIG